MLSLLRCFGSNWRWAFKKMKDVPLFIFWKVFLVHNSDFSVWISVLVRVRLCVTVFSERLVSVSGGKLSPEEFSSFLLWRVFRCAFKIVTFLLFFLSYHVLSNVLIWPPFFLKNHILFSSSIFRYFVVLSVLLLFCHVFWNVCCSI